MLPVSFSFLVSSFRFIKVSLSFVKERLTHPLLSVKYYICARFHYFRHNHLIIVHYVYPFETSEEKSFETIFLFVSFPAFVTQSVFPLFSSVCPKKYRKVSIASLFFEFRFVIIVLIAACVLVIFNKISTCTAAIHGGFRKKIDASCLHVSIYFLPETA